MDVGDDKDRAYFSKINQELTKLGITYKQATNYNFEQKTEKKCFLQQRFPWFDTLEMKDPVPRCEYLYKNRIECDFGFFEKCMEVRNYTILEWLVKKRLYPVSSPYQKAIIMEDYEMINWLYGKGFLVNPMDIQQAIFVGNVLVMTKINSLTHGISTETFNKSFTFLSGTKESKRQQVDLLYATKTALKIMLNDCSFLHILKHGSLACIKKVYSEVSLDLSDSSFMRVAMFYSTRATVRWMLDIGFTCSHDDYLNLLEKKDKYERYQDICDVLEAFFHQKKWIT